MIKIDSIYLSTGFPDDSGDSSKAKRFLDQNGVKYTHLHYGNEDQWEQVFNAFSTWEDYVSDKEGNVDKSQTIKHEVTAFPILHYDIVNDDYTRTRVVVPGLDAILDSNIVALSKVLNGG